MTQKLYNNETAELMEELGSRVLSPPPLPLNKEHKGECSRARYSETPYVSRHNGDNRT